jgi:D-methionine transport system substrate-binding protein
MENISNQSNVFPSASSILTPQTEVILIEQFAGLVFSQREGRTAVTNLVAENSTVLLGQELAAALEELMEGEETGRGEGLEKKIEVTLLPTPTISKAAPKNEAFKAASNSSSKMTPSAETSSKETSLATSEKSSESKCLEMSKKIHEFVCSIEPLMSVLEEKPSSPSESLSIKESVQIPKTETDSGAQAKEPEVKNSLFGRTKPVSARFSEMTPNELIFLAKTFCKDRPSLTESMVKELAKKLPIEERSKLLESLQKEHPLLAVQIAKTLPPKESQAMLQNILKQALPDQPEVAFAAAKAMRGETAEKTIKEQVMQFKAENPMQALEWGKMLLGKENPVVLKDLAKSFIKEHPQLSFMALQEIRGEERLTTMASFVKELHKQSPELGLKLASMVLAEAKAHPSPEIRAQALALITPPLEIKSIELSGNPFALGATFRGSSSSSKKSRAKPRDKEEEEEEENKGAALFTFYISASLDADFVKKIQKALLLEGIQIHIREVKNYEKLYKDLEEEKMGSLFFHQKKSVKKPFEPLVDLYIQPFGLYSERIRSLEELTSSSLVAIPSDLEDKERAEIFLKQIGIEKCLYLERGREELVSCLKQVDAGILPAIEAWRFGYLPKALALEDSSSPYVTALFVRGSEIQDKDFVFLKSLLASETMRSYVLMEYQGVVIPVF